MNMQGSTDIPYEVDHAGGFAARIGRESGALSGGTPVRPRPGARIESCVGVRRFTQPSSKSGYQHGACPPITETHHDEARFLDIAQRKQRPLGAGGRCQGPAPGGGRLLPPVHHQRSRSRSPFRLLPRLLFLRPRSSPLALKHRFADLVAMAGHPRPFRFMAMPCRRRMILSEHKAKSNDHRIRAPGAPSGASSFRPYPASPWPAAIAPRSFA
jgi:hypothetical protein